MTSIILTAIAVGIAGACARLGWWMRGNADKRLWQARQEAADFADNFGMSRVETNDLMNVTSLAEIAVAAFPDDFNVRHFKKSIRPCQEATGLGPFLVAGMNEIYKPAIPQEDTNA